MTTSFKIKASDLLRNTGLFGYADKMRFYVLLIKRINERRNFLKRNPGVKLPPAYLVYESFDLNYETYYCASRETTIWLLEYFKKYYVLNNINILDWGCGPARIARHLPDFLDETCSVYATDYNQKSIAWCIKAVNGVNFNLNGLYPPLPYVNDSFDITYGISIFTHLSEELHYKWFDELIRISKNNAIIFLTLHGDSFKSKLTHEEQTVFESGNLLVRGNTKTGHRTYTAFHPEKFVRNLFQNHIILEHVKGGVINNKPQQDIWIIKTVKKSDKQ